MSSAPISLSVIVPFHRDLVQLRRCLGALHVAGQCLASGAAVREVIVVADGTTENPHQIVKEAGARLLAIDGPRGPAVARSRGAACATGNVLVFVDSDVVVNQDALARFSRLFEEGEFAAIFGAYDEQPDDPGFVSLCRNLAHSFIHRRAAGEAQTFWCGLGAVRSEVFRAVGGFDERFRRPSVEDIDLGYRIRAAGWRILLDPRIEGQHLKRWTLRSALVSDIRDRGVPWTQLLRRYGGLHNDLNLTLEYRLSVVLAYALAICLMLTWWWPGLALISAASGVALWWLDRSYYGYFARRLGIGCALAWFPLHTLHHLCNGLSFIVGNVLYVSGRWFGVVLPGMLPLLPWPEMVGSGASGWSTGARSGSGAVGSGDATSPMGRVNRTVRRRRA